MGRHVSHMTYQSRVFFTWKWLFLVRSRSLGDVALEMKKDERPFAGMCAFSAILDLALLAPGLKEILTARLSCVF